MNKKTRQDLALKVAPSIMFLVLLSSPSYSMEHQIVPRDTLWDLASKHLRSPWDWPYITNLDGSQIEDVYSIPNGHKVWIPAIEDIVNLPIPFEKAGAPEVVILAAKRNKNLARQFERNATPKGNVILPGVSLPQIAAAPQKHSDEQKSNINAPSKSSFSNPYHYVLVNKKDGLVRAFIDGQHVTLPVSKLIELYAEANPGLDVKKIGDGIAISKTLIKEMLGLKSKE